MPWGAARSERLASFRRVGGKAYRTLEGERISTPTTFTAKGAAPMAVIGRDRHRSRRDWHDPRLGEVSFDEVAKQWMIVKSPQLRPATVHLYGYMLRVHISPYFGTRRHRQTHAADSADMALAPSTATNG